MEQDASGAHVYGAGTVREILPGQWRGFLSIAGKRRSFSGPSRDYVEAQMLQARGNGPTAPAVADLAKHEYGTGTIREIKTGKDAGAFRGYLVVDSKRRSFWARTREDVERKML